MEVADPVVDGLVHCLHDRGSGRVRGRYIAVRSGPRTSLSGGRDVCRDRVNLHVVVCRLFGHIGER